MRFRIFTEPQQGANYDDILAVAPAAEIFANRRENCLARRRVAKNSAVGYKRVGRWTATASATGTEPDTRGRVARDIAGAGKFHWAKLASVAHTGAERT